MPDEWDSAAGGRPVVLTAHALARMEDRGITPPMLWAVLRLGRCDPDPTRGTIRLRLFGVTAVATTNRTCIITVYARPNPPARTSPKRLARQPGQTRRRIERRHVNWVPDCHGISRVA